MNSVVLIGRLVRDPELRFIPTTGMAVVKFTLAVDRELSKEKRQEAADHGKQTADFIGVTAFGKTAENAANYLAKGRQCAVSGRIQTGSYTDKDGNKRYTTDVIASRVEFIGSNGQAKAQKNEYDDTEDIFTPVDDEDIPF